MNEPVRQFVRGQLARVTAAFKDASVAVDPDTVTFRVRSPAGTVTAYVYGVDADVVRDGLGNYHVDLALPTAGAWYWRWEATGTYAAAEEGSLLVTKGHFA